MQVFNQRFIFDTEHRLRIKSLKIKFRKVVCNVYMEPGVELINK